MASDFVLKVNLMINCFDVSKIDTKAHFLSSIELIRVKTSDLLFDLVNSRNAIQARQNFLKIKVNSVWKTYIS